MSDAVNTRRHPPSSRAAFGRVAGAALGLCAMALVVSAPRAGTLPPSDDASSRVAGSVQPSAASRSACSPHRLIAGRWPTSCWRPYSSNSPFNQPIPDGARVASDSRQVVARLLSFGPINKLVAGEADTPHDFGHPVYFSRPGDPVYTLHCYEAEWGRCSIEGMRIRVPAKAHRAGGTDAHLTVISRSGWEYDLYKVRRKPGRGGTLVFRWGGRIRIDGDGLGSAATASGFGSVAGIIRPGELKAGRIDHALFMVARCDAGRWVYPAAKSGSSCVRSGMAAAGAPPMGTRVQLAMSPAAIDALPVPGWKKTILRAMARYGMFLGDTGGGAWGIQLESGSTYTSFGHADPFVEFAKQNGWDHSERRYIGRLAVGVDWRRYLRVIDPCVTRRTC